MKKYICTSQIPRWPTGSSLKGKVYETIRVAGETGVNRREIADKTNLNVGRVSSYLAELKREGLVKRIGDAVDPQTLGPEEAALYALNAMENALIIKATKYGVTREMEHAFAKYQKIKSLAIGDGTTSPEAKSALRFSMIELIKLVF